MLADCPAIILEMGRRSVDEDKVVEESFYWRWSYRDQNRMFFPRKKKRKKFTFYY
jgi:hypothetical protein